MKTIYSLNHLNFVLSIIKENQFPVATGRDRNLGPALSLTSIITWASVGKPASWSQVSPAWRVETRDAICRLAVLREQRDTQDAVFLWRKSWKEFHLIRPSHRQRLSVFYGTDRSTNKAPSTRIRIFFVPQLFLSIYGFRQGASSRFDNESGDLYSALQLSPEGKK